jgi:hypothetical protein
MSEDEAAGAAHAEGTPNFPPPWLPLLRRLTEVSPGWGVWKNADRAIAVSGDIDSISPPVDRKVLLREFFGWASENDMSPMFLCGHLPGSVLGVAVRDRRELVELQLCEQAVFRGATLFTARELRGLMIMDPRGFRRLRSGSEGLLLLFFNAMKRGGRPSFRNEKAQRVLGLMRDDPEGKEAAASLFGPVQGSARRLAAAALDGDWERRSAARVEMWAVTQALKDPRLLVARAAFRIGGGRYCPLLPTLRRGRMLNGDVDAWLARARRAHTRTPSWPKPQNGNR